MGMNTTSERKVTLGFMCLPLKGWWHGDGAQFTLKRRLQPPLNGEFHIGCMQPSSKTLVTHLNLQAQINSQVNGKYYTRNLLN